LVGEIGEALCPCRKRQRSQECRKREREPVPHGDPSEFLWKLAIVLLTGTVNQTRTRINMAYCAQARPRGLPALNERRRNLSDHEKSTTRPTAALRHVREHPRHPS